MDHPSTISLTKTQVTLVAWGLAFLGVGLLSQILDFVSQPIGPEHFFGVTFTLVGIVQIYVVVFHGCGGNKRPAESQHPAVNQT